MLVCGVFMCLGVSFLLIVFVAFSFRLVFMAEGITESEIWAENA